MAKIPESLGPYKVSSSLGKGGTSQVFRAVHPTLKKTVVLKKLTLGRGQIMEERFRREAELMMSLNHPNIVQVYDLFKEGRSWVIVQEYVEGLNLYQLIHLRGNLPTPLASWIIHQCAKALAFIHRRGIIHRDIKPSNIFISKDGQVKLGDFGIAARIDDSQGLTREGAALGTPDYMPPEQILDPSSVDQRADIYALGISYFEALFGEPYRPNSKAKLALLLSFHGRTIEKAVRRKALFRYRSLAVMRARLRLSASGSSKKNRQRIVQALMEGRSKKKRIKEDAPKKLRVPWSSMAAALLVPLLALGLFWSVRNLALAGTHGPLSVRLVLPDQGHGIVLTPPELKLYRQRNQNLQRPRNVRISKPRGLPLAFHSRRLLLPSGYYRLEVTHLDSREWHSFYLPSRRDQLRDGEYFELSMNLAAVEAASVSLRYRVFDCFSDVDLREQAQVHLWAEERGWVRPGPNDLLAGESYNLRFTVPGYQDYFMGQQLDPLQRELHISAAMIPEAAILYLEGETNGVSLTIDGRRRYLSLEGEPHWQRLLFDGTPLEILPGSYELVFTYKGQSYPYTAELIQGQSLWIAWEVREDRLEFRIHP